MLALGPIETIVRPFAEPAPRKLDASNISVAAARGPASLCFGAPSRAMMSAAPDVVPRGGSLNVSGLDDTKTEKFITYEFTEVGRQTKWVDVMRETMTYFDPTDFDYFNGSGMWQLQKITQLILEGPNGITFELNFNPDSQSGPV